MTKLKREEITLKDKLEAVEANMALFMRDMGSLLEQHDVGHLLGSVLYGAAGQIDEEASDGMGDAMGNPLLMEDEEQNPHNESGGGGTGGP